MVSTTYEGVVQQGHIHSSCYCSAQFPYNSVHYAAEGTAEALRSILVQHLPVIVFVQTAELSYWNGQVSRHALVVVAMTETEVWVLDPAMLSEPICVPLEDFLLAWDEMDATYAVSRRI
ncbi:MAG: hypothetical protein JXA33_26670 [Anaerolineae bacterium]|nr:hypothetical protein [Anaerolineae bacterium]